MSSVHEEKIAVLGDVRDEIQNMDSATEKTSAVHVIHEMNVLGLSDDDVNFYHSVTEEERKRITRKIDIRLVPMLSMLYLFAHLDRANIGNAKIEGMDKDLKLTNIKWNISLSMFFVLYILLEVPCNFYLNRINRPSIYVGIITTLWGTVMTLHGVVQNFAGLVTLRLLLGALEAGFFPAAMYLCSFWYMPRDFSSRMAYFYWASALSGAFSGLLAAGIAQMDGLGGYQGWRWIFIIEGIGTVCIGSLSFFLLIDSPKLSTKWLSPKETRFLEIQLIVKEGGQVNGAVESKIRWKDLRPVLTNWRLYFQGFIVFTQATCSYALKFTLPTITKSMGFTNTNAQLMTVPPFIVGAISAIVFSKISDHFCWRMPFVLVTLLTLSVGYSIIISMNGVISGSHVGLAYFAIMLATTGIYPLSPAVTAWTVNNLAPAKSRALGLALYASMLNLGGIPGSFIFFDADAPAYNTGFGLCLALGLTSCIVALVLEFSFVAANRKRAQLNMDDIRAKHSPEELLQMGNKSPLFKYIL
ncbi:hypothetical protein N0V93_009663 [Gnomoniopsis smithogilvyi]|uniref:Major facilitator superfamily (MFS) profile domain-containing protein n=1 Tax=Gnomoniopsis smithogilvyi TaxID=1191159 RepID=A0A9W8YN92_9PEZI|nr:hypothetical protein N0V93_009663 [Gnomoniopsis smithogilvyi]